MGCTASKLDDEDRVLQLCKERKKFVKQAVEQRNRFASDHVAYIQSLRRISAALVHYVEANDRRDFFNIFPLKSLEPKKKKQMKSAAHDLVNYLRSGGIPTVSVEDASETTQETVRIESYYPMDHHQVNNSSFALHAAPTNQSSLWDHLWNYFPSLGSFGYPSSSIDKVQVSEDADVLRQIREAEGIPELEDVNSEDNNKEKEKPKAESKHAGVQVGGETESSEQTNQDFVKLPEVEEVEEAPGFSVYVNRRLTNMTEVMKDMEKQFIRICSSAHDVSEMLQASTLDRLYDRGSSEYLEGYMVTASHKATLDRLYEWEKKLLEQVKSGERVRIAYERKCMQLRSQDIYGEEASAVDQTRAAIRDLYTHFKVYIHTVESISKRIEALRDAELYPQLMELIQGLSRIWKTMADSHQIQKRIIEDAKLLFSDAHENPSKLPRGATILAAEIHNWRRCFANWINAKRSYAEALAGWASRCTSPKAADSIGNQKALTALSPFHGGEMPPVFGLCTRWSRLLESLSEKRAMEAMEFFSTGMASVSAQHREAAGAGLPLPGLVAVAEMAPRILCAGMSVAVGSMEELAVGAAEGFDALMRRCRGEGGTKLKRNVNGSGSSGV